MNRWRQVATDYRELLLVLAAAMIGLSVAGPLRWLGARHGIDALLIALVFSSSVTVSAKSFERLRASWRRVLGALGACATVLPVLAWVAARLVTAGPLRHGVLTIGLAPCEIASVAATGMAGGEPIIAAAVLVGSTGVAVVVAGPILAAEAGHSAVNPAGVLVSLLIVVVAPLAAGLLVRIRWPAVARYDDIAERAGLMTLIGLVALVAAQVELGWRYVGVIGAVVVFLIGSAALGWLLGRGVPGGTAIPLLLTTSMRDFAIAAGTGERSVRPEGVRAPRALRSGGAGMGDSGRWHAQASTLTGASSSGAGTFSPLVSRGRRSGGAPMR